MREESGAESLKEGKQPSPMPGLFRDVGKGAPPSVKRARNGSPQTLESGFDPLRSLMTGGYRVG